MVEAGAEPILEVRHIAKSYGRRPVLTDASLAVSRGECVAVTGENGTGKTTLLKVAVGLLSPAHGEVVVRGRLGYCPQEAHVFDTLTIREHFAWFAAGYGLAAGARGERPTWHDRRDALLDRFRFGAWADTLVSRLSGGTRQKLNLALALLHEPDLLVLDEPYAAFDWETYLRFWEFAADLRSAGAGLLIVSHFIYDRGAFDRVYELQSGALACT